jgi:hypothetical protein
MRIAHITTDEVNQAIALHVAERLGATVTVLGLDDRAKFVLFDAVLYDLDRIAPDHRRRILDELRSETTALPVAVYGYCLSEEQAGRLRFQGVAVAQRLHAALVRTLVTTVRQNFAAVPPDDALTELTWINLSRD